MSSSPRRAMLSSESVTPSRCREPVLSIGRQTSLSTIPVADRVGTKSRQMMTPPEGSPCRNVVLSVELMQIARRNRRRNSSTKRLRYAKHAIAAISCRGNGPEAYESQDGDIASSPLLGSRRPARTVSKLGMTGTARRPNSYT